VLGAGEGELKGRAEDSIRLSIKWIALDIEGLGV